MSPLVSVIMSVYREPDIYIKASVESILQQTLTDLEFIIIQDDPLNERVASLLLRYAREGRRIRYLRNEKKLGLALSLNRGLKIAEGKYIARMDADDISEPERLELQINFMNKNQDHIVCGTNIFLINENGSEIGPRKYFQTDEKIKKNILQMSPFAHPSVMIRKKVLTDNNILYSEKYPRA